MNAEMKLGPIVVQTTNNRGFTPEEIAERALDRVISIGVESHPAIREQALAFRAQLRGVLVHYMREAVNSERTTLAAKLRQAGHEGLVPLITS